MVMEKSFFFWLLTWCHLWSAWNKLYKTVTVSPMSLATTRLAWEFTFCRLVGGLSPLDWSLGWNAFNSNQHLSQLSRVLFFHKSKKRQPGSRKLVVVVIIVRLKTRNFRCAFSEVAVLDKTRIGFKMLPKMNPNFFYFPLWPIAKFG